MTSPSVDSPFKGAAQGVAPRARIRQLRLKRWLDVAISATALVVLLPLFAIVAIFIRLDSVGPVFFRQTRIGRRERPFEMWKFRTMVHDAPDAPHRELVLALARGLDGDQTQKAPSLRIYKLADDPRITAVGRWLRQLSVDELPQLLNVLRGEMSLVGPRPPVPYEYDAYHPWQRERFEMPQGITGLWQVSGRNRVSYRRMHELDIEYVRAWSLGLDLKILARTLRAVVVDREPSA